MKRVLVAGMLCAIFVDSVAGVTEDARLAIRNGAAGKYTYRVVDDEGNPVAHAQAHVWFSSYGRPQDKADWIVETDTNGMFSVEHRFNEQFSVEFDKEGYYHSHDEINYLAMPELPVKEGKWQPYDQVRTMVMKRIKSPGTVSVFCAESHRRSIPVWGEWIGFDLESGDWTPPYGKGKFKDVLLRFNAEVRKRRVDYSYAMDVCFTNNPYGGAYQMKFDEGSDLRTKYQADTNLVFQGHFSFSMVCSPGKAVVSNFVDSESYLVFRTRTRVDANGNLVGAHYGKMCGTWRSTHKEMLLSDGCFNPRENDTNIEGDQTLLYSIRNYQR